ncbi:LysR family transcriptional regulator [Pseudovibrio sp. Tun.PSC04-5.I4]|uniref:LysR family transcriptional regulator n=1 Tax=Pseudovibrio sp. Tun.PSC04-5.I4 TaxID=1798213 RepID=UPI00088C6F17|nr:LysR family transcriptional regulator [Pseudovibrio sp. Tun.PSC04-5.I4]SDR03521.1 DNA-binding transcriptional regulator, LysR family [Pseudovibrio sp. Tun.PSC04-5.I4]
MDRSRYLYGPALRYFAEAAEANSIRAAARKLNVASSAVNRQILTLEKQLGMELFERVGRTIRLSSAGEILLAHIRRTLSDLHATGDELDALKGLRRGVVSIATVESVTEAILPELIAQFRKDYSGIHVKVQVMSADRVAQAVERAEVDVGFTFEPPETDALHVSFKQALQIGAIMAPTHPLAGKEDVTLAQCFEHPVAMPAHGISLRGRLDVALSLSSIGGLTSVEANSLRFMKHLVRSGEMIAFQTVIGLEEELAAQRLVFKPLADPALAVDHFCIITSSLRGLALAPAIFFEQAVARLEKMLPTSDA